MTKRKKDRDFKPNWKVWNLASKNEVKWFLEEANEELNAAKNEIEAFINEVEAQHGKKISEEDADILVNVAETIIEHIDDAITTPL